jgi:demethylmenaquinone methyltransferase/2-methoxy-6-polyprenyl-1,4-benzoquinol methylase
MVDSFHHLNDQASCLEELWRVLEPGGRLVIEEPDISHPAVKLVAVVEKLLFMRSRFVPPRRIAGALAALGAQAEILREGHVSRVIATKPRSA